MPTLSEKLKDAETILRTHDVADPCREAMSLLMLATKRDKTFVYARPEYVLTAKEIAALDSFLERRANREPLQYISGLQEFYGRDFEVTPDVLIPRPETEMVVEHAVAILRQSGGNKVCDVGTGSGCIVISMLCELPGLQGAGLDASDNALKIAERNAARHDVRSRLELRRSDLFSALGDEKFDLIASNPPYVPADDIAGLQAEVRDFEPHIALTDNSDGLSIIRRIVGEAPRFMLAEGHLLLEIGFDQSRNVTEMFDTTRWHPPELFPDLQGIPRLVSARLR